MEFSKYMHIERIGTDEVDGILTGGCYLFPKLDGTNASVWLGEDGLIHAGSRKRDLTLEKDNASFYSSIQKDENILKFLTDHPTLRLYGEWLVKHTIKDYRDDAWRNFYVFDVTTEDGTYIDYQVYAPMLDDYEINYIPYLAFIENPTIENIVNCANSNTYMMKDGAIGEGVVIKRYDFVNKYGRTVWAKFVRNEFKDKHYKEMGGIEICNQPLELELPKQFITKELIEKTKAKITLSSDGWESKMIPRLLETIWYEFINENMWEIIKKHKNPTIDFKSLKSFVIKQIKEVAPEFF